MQRFVADRPVRPPPPLPHKETNGNGGYAEHNDSLDSSPLYNHLSALYSRALQQDDELSEPQASSVYTSPHRQAAASSRPHISPAVAGERFSPVERPSAIDHIRVDHQRRLLRQQREQQVATGAEARATTYNTQMERALTECEVKNAALVHANETLEAELRSARLGMEELHSRERSLLAQIQELERRKADMQSELQQEIVRLRTENTMLREGKDSIQKQLDRVQADYASAWSGVRSSIRDGMRALHDDSG